MKEYRFFHTTLDETGKRRQYLLQSIEFSKLLKDLIAFCRSLRSRRAIAVHIARTAGCSSEEAVEYADFLIDPQLLVNRFRPNITGADYLSHLTSLLNMRQEDELPGTLAHILGQVTVNHPLEANHFQKFTDQLDGLLPVQRKERPAAGLSVILKCRM